MKEFMIPNYEEPKDIGKIINIPRGNIVCLVRNAYLNKGSPKMNISGEEEIRGKALAEKLKNGLKKL